MHCTFLLVVGQNSLTMTGARSDAARLRCLHWFFCQVLLFVVADFASCLNWTTADRYLMWNNEDDTKQHIEKSTILKSKMAENTLAQNVYPDLYLMLLLIVVSCRSLLMSNLCCYTSLSYAKNNGDNDNYHIGKSAIVKSKMAKNDKDSEWSPWFLVN